MSTEHLWEIVQTIWLIAIWVQLVLIRKKMVIWEMIHDKQRGNQ